MFEMHYKLEPTQVYPDTLRQHRVLSVQMIGIELINRYLAHTLCLQIP